MPRIIERPIEEISPLTVRVARFPIKGGYTAFYVPIPKKALKRQIGKLRKRLKLLARKKRRLIAEETRIKRKIGRLTLWLTKGMIRPLR